MKRPRFILYPGHVVSRTDGDRHYIGAGQLAKLYKVDPRECVCAPDNPVGWSAPLGLITLYPRDDGDYRPPWCHGHCVSAPESGGRRTFNMICGGCRLEEERSAAEAEGS